MGASLGLALCETYLLFRQASEDCPVGPIVAAEENLAEALRSFGYRPNEAEAVVTRCRGMTPTPQREAIP